MTDQVKASKAVPDEVLAAAQHLIQVAVKHNTMIAGFALSEDLERKFIMPFGTLREADILNPTVYSRLCKLGNPEQTTGPVEHIHVGNPD